MYGYVFEEIKKRYSNVEFNTSGLGQGKCSRENRWIKIYPLANEHNIYIEFYQAKSLGEIGNIGGPRCCKRDSYLSILSAIDFVKEHFAVEMEKPIVVCEHSEQNNQCIGNRCPFYKKQ